MVSKVSLHTHKSRQAKQDRLFHTNVQVQQLTKDHGPDYRKGWQSSHGRINLIPLCLTVAGETVTALALAKTWWQVWVWYFSPAAGKITNSKELGPSRKLSLVITERSTPAPFRGFNQHSHTCNHRWHNRSRKWAQVCTQPQSQTLQVRSVQSQWHSYLAATT